MSLVIFCDGCGDELCESGGLFFSPPDSEDDARKFHICVNCVPSIYVVINSLRNR